MPRNLCSFAAAAVLLALTGSQATWAQKPGAVIRIPHLDSTAACRSTHNCAYREFVALSAPKDGEEDF